MIKYLEKFHIIVFHLHYAVFEYSFKHKKYSKKLEIHWIF